jgi:lysophospholipase L1-like esterase
MRIFFLQLLVFLLSFSAISQTVQKLPPNSGIIYFGDSQTAFGFSSNGNAVQYQNYGYLAWVNALSPDVYTPKGGMLGVEGETTTQMVNRLSAIKTFDAKFIAVLAGTNDLTYKTAPETTESNLRQIYNAGISAGMQVIAITIMPRFGQNALDATWEANRKAINTWIKSQSDIVVVDVENDMNGSQYFFDGLHNNPTGAYVVGNKVAMEVNKRIAHCLPGSLSEADLSVGNTNPFFTGTGGSVNNASGSIASNWQLAGNQAGGAMVTGSKETDAAGKEKQVMSISGNYTGDYVLATLNNYANSPAGLKAGDVVEGVAEVEIASALTNVKSVYMRVIAYGTDWSILADGNSMFPTSSDPLMMPQGSYLLRTPAMTIGNGTVGLLSTQIVVEFNSASTTVPVSAIVKASSAGLRRLPLTAGPLAIINPAGTVSVCPGSPVTLNANTGNGYAYQWQVNGTDLTNATGTSVSAANPGSYTVKVTTTGCAVLSDPTVVITGNCQQGTIATGSVAASLCMGQSLGVPFTVTGTYNTGNVFTAQLSDANGSFAAPVSIGSLAGTANGIIAAAIPSTIAQGSNYRIRVVSSNPVITGTDNGSNLRISAIPALTSTLTPPAICNNAVFSYTPTSSVSGTTFNWSRAAIGGISNASATGTGSISEALHNTTTIPVNVTYVYTLNNNGCSSAKSYNVVVTVNPSPLVKTKNITVALDATGKATITPQQVDNGSTGCGTLQYSLDKTQFTCANIGANTVTLRVTDAAGNSSTGTATVTVVDNSGPSITNASAVPSVLWPADQVMVNVTINYSTADNCSTSTTTLSVKSNEAESGLFKHDKKDDWNVKSNHLVQLRAERDPSGTGRIYTITITAKDARGNTSTQDVFVKVPISQPVTTALAAKQSVGVVNDVEETGLCLTVSPNPAHSYFTLQWRSNSNQPVTIRTVDAAGRMIETVNNLAANATLQVGYRYRPGLYLVEALQGSQRVTLRLIKLGE